MRRLGWTTKSEKRRERGQRVMIQLSLTRKDQISMINVDEESFMTLFDVEKCLDVNESVEHSLLLTPDDATEDVETKGIESEIEQVTQRESVPPNDAVTCTQSPNSLLKLLRGRNPIKKFKKYKHNLSVKADRGVLRFMFSTNR
jgi:hypothetical protein